jgi:hypothetical protein
MRQLERFEDAPAFLEADGGGVPPALSAKVPPSVQAMIPVLPSLRTYEEIEGAEGREVFFRPHRYTASELTPLAARVVVELDGDSHACELRDVSQNGAAFAWPEGVSVELRQRFSIVLRFDTHEAFRGDAVVGSIRDQGGRTVIGISFVDFMLDVDEVLHLRDIQQWKARGQVPYLGQRAPTHDRFKATVAELRLYLETAQQELGDFESKLPWNVLHGSDNAARRALVAGLKATFVADVVRLSEDIDAALREVPEEHACAVAKDWSLRHVQGFLMQAPCCHRARYKPLGYPGDYGVMDFIYERNFEGATLFAAAVGLAFTNTRAAQAVRTRKELVKNYLKALLGASAAPQRPLRVLSIAAGPAQELVELLNGLAEAPAPVEVVLFEQDKNALAHAWRRLSLYAARFEGKVHFTFLHDSIKRLLRDTELFAPFGKFDVVYSCGLFDYLQDRTAVNLTRRLAALTRDGGRLLVANMVDHPTRWLMEHHLDWSLNYRTRQELLHLGRQAVPGGQFRLLEEESRVNPFLEVVSS